MAESAGPARGDPCEGGGGLRGEGGLGEENPGELGDNTRTD
jgi:hypothetical protein